MTIKKNLFSIIMIMALSIVLTFAIAVFFVSMTRSFACKAEINAKCGDIDKIAKKSSMPLSKESLIFLTDEYNRLKSVYSRFKLALESPLNDEATDEELEPLKFKERLIQAQKKLREDARMHNLTVPKSLGFAKYETELTDPPEIRSLIRRIDILEEIMYIILESGVGTLNEIDFAVVSSNAKEGEGEGSGRKQAESSDIPVYVSIGCTSPKLINFLYRLRVSQFNFVVDDVDITSEEDKERRSRLKRLNAGLSIRAVILN